MSEKPKKVYDYNQDAVRERLITAFRGKRGEATVADLAAATGLPLQQIDAELPAVSDEYGARLKVTESGELLYSFPEGMKSRYRGFSHTLARGWKAFKKGFVAVGKIAFKAWIVTMLVGYFVLFLALALFAFILSIAAQRGGGSSDSRSDRRGGGGIGGLWMTGRIFDSLIRIWFYSELFKGPNDRYRLGDERKEKKPLFKSVFSHVFGDGDPNASWPEIEKKAVVAFLQSHKGVITLPEFMAVTGLSPKGAEAAINRYMLEFEGTPEVSEGGLVYYFFPKLLAKVGTTPGVYGNTTLLKRLGKFSMNEPKADRTFRTINLVNVAFGSYFLYNAATIGTEFFRLTPDGYVFRNGLAFLYSASGYLFTQVIPLANPAAFITWGLGVVPLAFSALFFLIPILRAAKLERDNETLKAENLRRVVYRNILASPLGFKPESVVPPVDEARPRDTRSAEKIAEELAAWAGADASAAPSPSASQTDRIVSWDYTELARTQAEAVRVRDGIDLSRYTPGDTVFDSQA